MRWRTGFGEKDICRPEQVSLWIKLKGLSLFCDPARFQPRLFEDEIQSFLCAFDLHPNIFCTPDQTHGLSNNLHGIARNDSDHVIRPSYITERQVAAIPRLIKPRQIGLHRS